MATALPRRDVAGDIQLQTNKTAHSTLLRWSLISLWVVCGCPDTKASHLACPTYQPHRRAAHSAPAKNIHRPCRKPYRDPAACSKSDIKTISDRFIPRPDVIPAVPLALDSTYRSRAWDFENRKRTLGKYCGCAAGIARGWLCPHLDGYPDGSDQEQGYFRAESCSE